MILSSSLVLFLQWFLLARGQLMWFRCIVIPLISLWLLVVLISLVSLISFHVRLIYLNKTTNEFLKAFKNEAKGPMYERSFSLYLPTLLSPMWEEFEVRI